MQKRPRCNRGSLAPESLSPVRTGERDLILLSASAFAFHLIAYSFHMPALVTAARAREHLEGLLRQIARLRGGGPNPFDYYQWDARAQEVLTSLYGEGSPELQAYYEAAGVRGRLPGVRGQAENMTLNIHGDWGILARLKRAEAVFRSLISELPPE
jgi:hypothetical protein